MIGSIQNANLKNLNICMIEKKNNKQLWFSKVIFTGKSISHISQFFCYLQQIL